MPLLISVPHGGLRIPREVEEQCILKPEEVLADSDAGSNIAYDFASEVRQHLVQEVARAVVDLNRPEDDRRKDGVVKTHTCWNARVWQVQLREKVVEGLLKRYYRPYHRRLAALARKVRLSVDCHTMAAVGPPVGPDPGKPRPWVCLSDGDGAAPPAWRERMLACLNKTFDGKARHNDPFSGGFITRHHGQSTPWLQLELSRGDHLSWEAKRERVLEALRLFCQDIPDA